MWWSRIKSSKKRKILTYYLLFLNTVLEEIYFAPQEAGFKSVM